MREDPPEHAHSGVPAVETPERLTSACGECVGFEFHLLQQGLLQECGSSGPGHRTFTQGR